MWSQRAVQSDFALPSSEHNQNSALQGCFSRQITNSRNMMQGLRTLVLATRIVDEQQYQEWNRNYELAASSLEDREARIAAVSEKIERDLELVGVTAIEDKLQEGVPQAINSLITAGIKVHTPPDVTAKCSGRNGAQKAPHSNLR